MWGHDRDEWVLTLFVAAIAAVAIMVLAGAAKGATPPDPGAKKIAAAFLRHELAAERRHPGGAHTVSLTCVRAGAGVFACRDLGVDAHGRPVCIAVLLRWSPVQPGRVQFSPSSLHYCATPKSGGPSA